MKIIENVTVYFDMECSSNNDVTFVFYSDKMKELFSWRTPEWMDSHFKDHYVYNTLKQKFDNIQETTVIDEIHMLYEFDELVYGHGLFNFIRKIQKYPKNIPIFCTNFSKYILEIYNYVSLDGYKIYSLDECKLKFLGKKIFIKKLYVEDENSLVCTGGLFDFSYIRNLIKKPGVLFLRKDALTGINRKLLNSDDLKNLFLRYGYIVIDSFSSLSYHEKKMYLNNFDNIFIEAGCGLINLFLVDLPQKCNIYNLQSPSYDSSYVYSNIPDVNVINLSFGSVAYDSPLYGNRHDACNEPWRIDLEKMEDQLKKI